MNINTEVLENLLFYETIPFKEKLKIMAIIKKINPNYKKIYLPDESEDEHLTWDNVK